jgi:hypothetical protein
VQHLKNNKTEIYQNTKIQILHMSTEKTQPNPAVKECEEKYPQTTSEFKKILKEQ